MRMNKLIEWLKELKFKFSSMYPRDSKLKMSYKWLVENDKLRNQ